MIQERTDYYTLDGRAIVLPMCDAFEIETGRIVARREQRDIATAAGQQHATISDSVHTFRVQIGTQNAHRIATRGHPYRHLGALVVGGGPHLSLRDGRPVCLVDLRLGHGR